MITDMEGHLNEISECRQAFSALVNLDEELGSYSFEKYYNKKHYFHGY